MNSSSGRRLQGTGQRQNIMPARRVLIVVLIMFASLTVYNMNTLHNMVKKQMAVSSRWGAEQNVTQCGEGQPKLKRKSVFVCQVWLSERYVRRTSGNKQRDYVVYSTYIQHPPTII